MKKPAKTDSVQDETIPEDWNLFRVSQLPKGTLVPFGHIYGIEVPETVYVYWNGKRQVETKEVPDNVPEERVRAVHRIVKDFLLAVPPDYEFKTSKPAEPKDT